MWPLHLSTIAFVGWKQTCLQTPAGMFLALGVVGAENNRQALFALLTSAFISFTAGPQKIKGVSCFPSFLGNRNLYTSKWVTHLKINYETLLSFQKAFCKSCPWYSFWCKWQDCVACFILLRTHVKGTLPDVLLKERKPSISRYPTGHPFPYCFSNTGFLFSFQNVAR